jgi:MoCo/4Fe-4S cofactor protein with predicted Tat translocation signal
MSSVSPQWRSLDELANDQAFVTRASEEFPMLAEALASPPDRRRAIKLTRLIHRGLDFGLADVA